MSRTACLVMFGAGFLPASGCASLATNTGPTSSSSTWSTANRQFVHVGEVVDFDLILLDGLGRRVVPTGKVDYAIVDLGDYHLSAEPDEKGRIRFDHVFDDFVPGSEIKVQALAFRERGVRDFILVRGQWTPTDSPFDKPDKEVAGASIVLEVYAAAIELAFAAPADELDPDTGVLKVIRNDGHVSSVFRQTVLRPGFELNGPSQDGYYHMAYTPTGDQVSRNGTTGFELCVYDITGIAHCFKGEVETP